MLVITGLKYSFTRLRDSVKLIHINIILKQSDIKVLLKFSSMEAQNGDFVLTTRYGIYFKRGLHKTNKKS